MIFIKCLKCSEELIITKIEKIICPKCNEELIVRGYDYSGLPYINGGIAIFADCPKCNYIKGLFAKGKIPYELAKALFPEYKEVF